jgi:23S rRNA pseudoU1915 N3-methylase RlmH
MKKIIIAASVCSLLAVTQLTMAQGVQAGKAVKKEMKADKKMDKAAEYRKEAKTHAGLEIKGVSDPKTRIAKAEKKEKKAEKKELKSDAKELKAVAKVKTKKAAGVN